MRLTRILCCLLGLLQGGHVYAAPPSDDIVNACLHGKTIGLAKWAEIPTGDVTVDDDFPGGYKATLFKANGRDVGYAEKAEQTGVHGAPVQAGLVWGHSVTQLKNATVLDAQSSTPSDFSPLLAEWSLVWRGEQRFLCVNFNFDGLGRSGSFQKVHGLYLLSAPIRRGAKQELFYAVREPLL